MLIQLISIGTQMPDWVSQGYQTYAKRLTQEVQLELIELPTKKRLKNANTQQIQQHEETLLLSAADKADLIIALDPRGKSYTTEAFSERMQQWQLDGIHKVALLIGGPEGLTPTCLSRAHLRWSLSPLTFPHPLVRVIVAEQVYRAWTLQKSHPYHR